MPTNPTPSEVVERLTEAQRKALLHGRCSIPSSEEEYSTDCICSAGEFAYELCAMGLAIQRDRFPNGIVRTPFGLEVRSLLTKTAENPSDMDTTEQFGNPWNITR